MRHLLVIGVVLFALTMRADNVTVHVHESVTIDVDGATAAYAIDPAIVDVAMVRAGSIALTGLSSGTTQLIAVTASGTTAFLVTVGPARGASIPHAVAANEPIGRIETRYASDTSRLQSAFDVFMRDGERETQFHLMNVHYLGERFGGSSTAFPSMFYRVNTPHREITVGDDYVDASPLTVHGTEVRGFHLQDHTLELHAGYAAATMYEDLFLPADRRWVAGVGYGIDRGGIRWTPSLYAFLSEPQQTTARRGIEGALAAEYRRADALWLRGEVGVSRAIAVAADVRYDTAREHLLGHFTFKPSDFPTLGISDVPGAHGELAWTRRVAPRLTADTFGSYDDYHFQSLQQTFSNGSFLLRYAATPRLTITSGASVTDLRSTSLSVRTIAIPLGVAYDRPSFGASLSARVLDNDNASRRGDVVRLGVRASHKAFTTNLWVERQRQAPTLDLIFREEPGLALAFQRLGIAVHSPEEVERALRDNPALVNLGYIEGLTVNLTPRRLLAGFDVSWIGAGEGRDQLRFHAVADRDESVGTTRTATIGTLSYSRRVLAQTDLFGSISWWRGGAVAFQQDGKAVEAGVRQRFDGVPAILQRRTTIEGLVFLDPDMHGSSANAAPLPDVIVMLDGTQTTRSDTHGAYAFHGVESGPHTVTAQLPSSRPAYFTTASRVEVNGRARVDFGVIWSSARLNGRVASDAGIGIGGVTIAAVAASEIRIAATTDSDGRFVLDVPAGTYRVALLPETLPAGYTTEEGEQSVALAADVPRTRSFSVVALRSVAGTIEGADSVTIESLGRHAAVDAHGNFVFRSLPAGRLTLTATIAGRVVKREITLPAEPATLRDVTFEAGVPATAVAEVKPPAIATTAGAFVVQVGAFRDVANARQLTTRLERLGETPFTDRGEGLLLVRTGPFISRTTATTAVNRLRRAGIESYVLPR